MDDIQQLYEKRVKDLLKTTNHQEPDRVPLGIDVVTWPLAYSGYRLNGRDTSSEELASAYVTVFRELCCDCVLDPGITQSIAVYDALGGEGYKLSEDGVTVQHVMQNYDHIMSSDEYDALIDDPKNYLETSFPEENIAILMPKPKKNHIMRLKMQLLP